MKRGWRNLAWILLPAAISVTAPGEAEAQSVVEIYQRQYYRKQALRTIQENGERVQPRPPVPLATSADSLLRSKKVEGVARLSPPRPVLQIRHVQRIPKLAGQYFRNRFADEDWVFRGANRISPLDTMMTREIRARLQAHFGKPTQTIVDGDALERARNGDVFQFEYWFVLDGSIPLVITDVNGPFERGIATSTTELHEDRIIELRDALLSEVVSSDEKAPFVDYYYDDELDQWYRTGYDGTDFFLEPVERPGLSRPVLRADPE